MSSYITVGVAVRVPLGTPTDYIVLDATQVASATSAGGLRVGGAISSSSVAWGDVTGKPTTFAPIIGATGVDAVAGNDARLTDARVPLTHADSHEFGNSDVLFLGGLSGVLADPQPPIIGATATTAVAGNDARLTNARTPTAHAASHKAGGTDAISLDEFAGTTDIVALNSTTTAHGLLRKLDSLTTNFLRGDGVWAAPVSSSVDTATTALAGKTKVDNDSAGDPVALTSAGHGAAADPHPQYQLESEKAAASGYASLDGSTKVPIAQIPTGVTGVTVPFGNDARFSDARTPLAHASSHITGGSDVVSLLSLFGYPGGSASFLRADGAFAAPTATAADPAYAPSSFTLATGTFRIQVQRLTLTGAQRATLQGTARMRGI